MNATRTNLTAKNRSIIEALENRIAPAGIFKWNVNASGDWNVPGNWTLVSGDAGVGYPDGEGDEARFTNVITANRTVNIPNGVEITVGKMLFDDNNSYTITSAGSGLLVMDGVGEAVISVTTSFGSSSHLIQTAMELRDNLRINNVTTQALFVQSSITDDNNYREVEKTGQGIVELGGGSSNTYTGRTTVTEGVLRLNKTDGVSATGFGPVGVGGNDGSFPAQLILDGNEQMRNDAVMFIYGDGEFDLANFTETVDGIYLYTGQAGGSIKTGTGVLALRNIYTAVEGGGQMPATISGNLRFEGGAQDGFHVNDAEGNVDLDVSARILGTAGLNKFGKGTLQLSGFASQGYTGQTLVSDGTLLLMTNTADAGLSNDILIQKNGTLRFGTAFEVPDNAKVEVRGGRLEVLGAEDFTNLILDEGNVVIGGAGLLTLRAGGTLTVKDSLEHGGSTISGAGRLNLQQGMIGFVIGQTTSDADLLVEATITGTVVTAGITKSGAGKLLLTGEHTYQGETSVAAGTLQNAGKMASKVAVNGGVFLRGNTSLVFTGGFGGTNGRIEIGTDRVFTDGNVALGAGVTLSLTKIKDAFGLYVDGTVDLGGAKLDFSAPQGLFNGDSFVLLDNDGVEAITGTFAGLPEGATVKTASGNYLISYQGGTGNDVTLTPVYISPTILPGGKAATYIDQDGDQVTVKITKGTLTVDNFRLIATGEGAQLARLTLTDTAYAGSNVMFSAVPKKGLGDKRVDVQQLYATVDLGTIVIPGDLGRLQVGTNLAGPAFKSLTVNSFGESAPVFDSGTTYISKVFGGFGSIKVKGDFIGANLQINTGGEAAGSITIGGSVLTGPSNGTAFISMLGKLGKFTLGGSLVGGTVGGRMAFTGDVGQLTIGGAVFGGSAGLSGSVTVDGNIGALTIGKGVFGGDAKDTGKVKVIGVAKTVKIGGSVIGSEADQSGVVELGGDVQSLTLNGDLQGGSGISSGAVKILGAAKTVKIAGSVLGGGNGSGLLAQKFGAVTIGGEVRGTEFGRAVIAAAGSIDPATSASALAIASLTVGKNVSQADVLAGYAGSIELAAEGDVQIGKVAVKGNWTSSRLVAGIDAKDGLFGNGNDEVITGSSAGVVSRIASIQIGGKVQGSIALADAHGFFAEEVGAMTVGGKKIALSSTAKDTISFGMFGDTLLREI